MSRSGKGERDWNSKPILFGVGGCISYTGVGRKLQDVCQELTPLGEQGKVEGFLNNVENADRLGSLVEDIRDAMMEYQVCVHNLPIVGTSDVRIRLRYSKISTTRAVNSSRVSPHCLSSSQTNRYIGIGGHCPSQQHASYHRRWVSVWKQEGVPEGNTEGCPVGDRILVHGRTGPAYFLVEWPRRD